MSSQEVPQAIAIFNLSSGACRAFFDAEGSRVFVRGPLCYVPAGEGRVSVPAPWASHARSPGSAKDQLLDWVREVEGNPEAGWGIQWMGRGPWRLALDLAEHLGMAGYTGRHLRLDNVETFLSSHLVARVRRLGLTLPQMGELLDVRQPLVDMLELPVVSEGQPYPELRFAELGRHVEGAFRECYLAMEAPADPHA